MKNKHLIILGIVLLLGIGFAATFTAVLSSGGNLYAEKGFGYNVVFNVDDLDNSAGTVNLGDSGKTLTFTSNTLKYPGDKATFYYKVQNLSSYDVIVKAINCTGTTSGTYFKITTNNPINLTKVSANSVSSNTNSITFEMIKAYDQNKSVQTASVTCSITSELMSAS